MQLEWRALEASLRASGPERQKALTDALVFRAYRRSLFPNAAADERDLEMNEGLAEYTGVKLSSASNRDAIEAAINVLAEGTQKQTFVRSFAYASGPAYGLMLDVAASEWRETLSLDDDLGELLREAFSITLSGALEAEAQERAKRYDGNRLTADETQRDTARQRRIARHRARLVDGPVLVIHLRSPNVQFNPGNLQPLGEFGTVYPTMTLTDSWGILTVTNGALLNSSWSEVRVTAPKATTDQPIKGDGWVLELKNAWKLKPGKRTGDYVVAR